MIESPGIYELSSEEYHADDALSSTGARRIIMECPAAYRFTPEEAKVEFDIGNAVHLLVLQPEQFEARIARIEADDYRTKAAKEARDAARASCRIPLLPDQVEMVEDMREAVYSHPIARLAFLDGAPEQSLFWRDPEFGIMCRTRPDWLPRHRKYLVDVKSAMSAEPRDFAKAVVNYGYHMQAAFYCEGVESVFGERPERFAFVVVQKKSPYLVSVCWLDEEAIQWGRILNRRAKGIFAWCLQHNHWPGYQPDITAPPAAFTVSLPDWYAKDLQRRHEAGEFEPPQVMETA